MLKLRNIIFSYGTAPLITGLHLDVEQGGYTVLRGESGCGKSTLLRLLCRLEVPRSGELLLDGVPYDDISPRTLRRRLALLQQLPVMIEGSVRDNLLLSLRYGESKSTSQNDDDLRELLRRARLHGISLDNRSLELSAGQRQRIALIRLLLMNPDALLLDEPTAALDPESSAVIFGWISELHRSGKTILMVSHSRDDSFPGGARRLRMENGGIREES